MGRKACLVVACCLVQAGCLVSSETPSEWRARIDANIDRVRKSDAEIRIDIQQFRGRSIKLIVNQTRQTFPMGTALQAYRIAQCQNNGQDSAYCAFARDNFNYAVDEWAMKWRDWEPNRDDIRAGEPDKMIEWARAKGWGVRGHCLFWDVPDDSHFPDWVKGLSGQDMVDAIYHRIDTAVPHYRGLVEHWDINNEMLHGQFFPDKTGDPRIREKMFIRAEEVAPEIRRFVNDYNVLLYEPDGFIQQIRDLLNNGAPVNGIGCQAHMGPDSIDLGKVEDSLNRFWNEFHIPIWITEFDFQGDGAGDHSQHAAELENFYRLLFSHESVEGIMMWGFWDKAHWRPDAAICNGDNFQLNKAGEAYVRLFHETFQTHRVLEPEMVDNGEAIFRFRGFRADYAVSVMDTATGEVTTLPQLYSLS